MLRTVFPRSTRGRNMYSAHYNGFTFQGKSALRYARRFSVVCKILRTRLFARGLRRAPRSIGAGCAAERAHQIRFKVRISSYCIPTTRVAYLRGLKNCEYGGAREGLVPQKSVKHSRPTQIPAPHRDIFSALFPSPKNFFLFFLLCQHLFLGRFINNFLRGIAERVVPFF